MRKNILITGAPKSGKSTLLEQLIVGYPNKVGFLTKEIRKDEIRVGFEMILHNGPKTLLSDVDTEDSHKVGKYFVHPQNIDPFLEHLSLPSDGISLLYVDEIGQMQLFSDLFRKTVLRFFETPNTCVATITSVYEDDFTQSIKNRDDVILVEITPENREGKLEFLKMLLKKIDKAKGYSAEPGRFTFENDTHTTIKSEHGTRRLVLQNNVWSCECDFFRAHGVCSHVIAVESINN
jgi:nucleoside-triphosphatase THEP1